MAVEEKGEQRCREKEGRAPGSAPALEPGASIFKVWVRVTPAAGAEGGTLGRRGCVLSKVC